MKSCQLLLGDHLVAGPVRDIHLTELCVVLIWPGRAELPEELLHVLPAGPGDNIQFLLHLSGCQSDKAK